MTVKGTTARPLAGIVARGVVTTFCLVLLGYWHTAMGADSDAASELPRVRKLWNQRGTHYRTAHYRLRGETLHTAGSLVSPDDPDFEPGEIPATGYPVSDTTTTFVVDWLIDLQHGLFRKQSRDVAFNVAHKSFRPLVRDEVFDGQSLRGHWPRDANTSEWYVPGATSTDVIYWRAEDASLVVNLVDLPLLLMHGLASAPTAERTHAILGLVENLQVVGKVVIDGRDCLQVRTASGPLVRDLFVDLAAEGVIRRIDDTRQGRLSSRVNVDYRDSDLGMVVDSWHVMEFDGAIDASEARASTEHRVSVEEVEFDVPARAADFALQLKPGYIVLRRDQGFSKFRVSSDGELTPLSGLPLKRRSSRQFWVIVVVNVVLLVILGAVYLARSGAPLRQTK